MTKKIVIIIITYNVKDIIVKCLDSLKEQSYQDFNLTIIDNNSTDNTPDVLRDYLKKNSNMFKRTTLYINNYNSGFAKAVNVGLKHAKSQKNIYAVLLLNPDTYFTNNLLSSAIKTFEQQPTAGALVPKILYPDNTIWWSGTRILSNRELVFSPKYGIAEHSNKGILWKTSNYQTKDVEAITGCALFIRMDAVKKVGLFNEKYFMYAEDIDYSNRLKKYGYKLLLFTQATVFHEVKDKKKDLKLIQKSLKKYKIYLKSVAVYLLENKPLYIFICWLLKLPYALAFNYFKKNN